MPKVLANLNVTPTPKTYFKILMQESLNLRLILLIKIENIDEQRGIDTSSQFLPRLQEELRFEGDQKYYANPTTYSS